MSTDDLEIELQVDIEMVLDQYRKASRSVDDRILHGARSKAYKSILALIAAEKQQSYEQGELDVLDELFRAADFSKGENKGWDSHQFITLAIEKMNALTAPTTPNQSDGGEL